MSHTGSHEKVFANFDCLTCLTMAGSIERDLEIIHSFSLHFDSGRLIVLYIREFLCQGKAADSNLKLNYEMTNTSSRSRGDRLPMNESFL